MDTQLGEQAHKELLASFEDRVANIRDLKRYEWQAAYYAVALIGALVAIARWSASNVVFRFLLLIGCGIVAWTWYKVEESLQEGLARQRDDLNAVYSLFSQQVQQTRPPRRDDDTISRALRVMVFVTVILAGLAIFALLFLP